MGNSTEASAGSGTGQSWSERLGWRAHRRPEAAFSHVLAAGAGVFAVLAVVSLIAEIGSDDPTAPGVLLSLALAAGAFFLGRQVPGPLRSAAVTVLVLTTPLVLLFGFAGDGQTSRGDLRAIYLLSVLVYGLLYLLGWTRGRAVLLGALLLFAATWAVFEVGGDSGTAAPFQSEISSSVEIPLSSGGTSSSGTSLGQQNETDDTTSAAALVVGLVLLGAAAALDRRSLAGAATPFIIVGSLFALSGAIVLGGNESATLGGLLAVAIGAAIGLVGALGRHRRGTIWSAGIAVAGGLVAVVVDLASDSTIELAGFAALAALGLGAVAFLAAPRLHEATDDKEASAPA